MGLITLPRVYHQVEDRFSTGRLDGILWSQVLFLNADAYLIHPCAAHTSIAVSDEELRGVFGTTPIAIEHWFPVLASEDTYHFHGVQQCYKTSGIGRYF
jgi:hypothetical protein